MSYMCAVCNEEHKGINKVLVPVSKRKVFYSKYTTKNFKDIKDVDLDTVNFDDLFFLGQHEGWEIAKEIAVCEAKAKQVEEQNANNFVSDSKTVRFLVKSSPKRTYKTKPDESSDFEEESDKYLHEKD